MPSAPTSTRTGPDGRSSGSRTLLLIGPFADPRDGAMGVFTTEEAAEDFASGDPFVLHGLVAHWRITAWNEVLLDPV